ncbi:arabinofuranosidase [Dentipellis sp. KUC8613]|nr:arabinofuranosidase [Dentipellis sp. KUC8613]
MQRMRSNRQHTCNCLVSTAFATCTQMLFNFPSLWLTAVLRLATASDHVHSKAYHNPVLPGFHPDPSCTRVPEWDNTFFCATSSFNAVPGVPVFASKDLQNFRQIGNVITRESQLPGIANTNGATSGIWAPSVRYHNGTFWVVTTLVYDHLPQNDPARWDNVGHSDSVIGQANSPCYRSIIQVIFKSTNPFDSSSWSDALHFTFEGYDTSPFWDDDGKTYIVGSHAWQVRPMIQGFEIDPDSAGIIGDIHDMWPGTGGIAPEAPHLFTKDDWYYLMIAEGGTGLNHMVTYARSRSMWGQYDPDPANPVLTNANTTQYFQTVGHADIFNDTAGNWWAVALSTRSGPEYTYYPMGRETVLTPAEWKEGQFPTFTPVRGQETGPLPAQNKQIGGNGNWAGQDDFLNFPPGSSLPVHFVHNRFPDPSAYTVSPPGHLNTLCLTPSVLNLTSTDARTAVTPQTFVGRRQEHVEFVFTVRLSFASQQDGAEAGATVFLNQGQHFDLGVVTLTPQSAAEAGYTGKPANASARYIRLRTITASSSDQGASDPLSKPDIFLLEPSLQRSSNLQLQIEAVNRTTYAFRYETAGGWATVGFGNSSQVSGGFVGTIVGLFATGNGANVSDPAYFSNFSYKGNHAVF